VNSVYTLTSEPYKNVATANTIFWLVTRAVVSCVVIPGYE
jgi:hypothetical protein